MENLPDDLGNVQLCAGCNKPLTAPPYGVVGHDNYVCSEECLLKAQLEDQTLVNWRWGPAVRIMDIARRKNYYKDKDQYLPFHKFGVNLGTGRLSHEHVYLPEMVREQEDLQVFGGIQNAVDYAVDVMDYGLYMNFLWGFDGHTWVPLEMWVTNDRWQGENR